MRIWDRTGRTSIFFFVKSNLEKKINLIYLQRKALIIFRQIDKNFVNIGAANIVILFLMNPTTTEYDFGQR